MNEDWLNKVRDRMSDYEIDEPENLWDAIESRVAARRQAKTHVMIWVKRSIAAAAMIAVVITLGIYFADVKNDIKETQLLLSDVTDEPSPAGDNNRQNLAGNITMPNKLAAHNNAGAAVAAVVTDAPTHTVPAAIQDETEPVTEVTPAETPADVAEENKRVVNEYRPLPAENNQTQPVYAKDRNRKSDSNISVSVYSSGSTGGSTNLRSAENFLFANDHFAWSGSAQPGPVILNHPDRENKPDIKHRLPIRAGVSFTYNFNDRLGIESGLSYAYLVSDIKSYNYAGEQKLHYIGIPLNLKYRVLSWKGFDLYVSAGVLAEKCVSAKLEKDLIINNQKVSSESENLSDKPMQWSVNATPGIQYHFVKPVSVFVEPGVSYYFKDGTDIQTIYRDKPLNFNLNIGLRLTICK